MLAVDAGRWCCRRRRAARHGVEPRRAYGVGAYEQDGPSCSPGGSATSDRVQRLVDLHYEQERESGGALGAAFNQAAGSGGSIQ